MIISPEGEGIEPPGRIPPARGFQNRLAFSIAEPSINSPAVI